MQYNISFKRIVKGFNAYEYVGDDFVVLDIDAGELVQDVVGVAPSHWKGFCCDYMIKPLKRAVERITIGEDTYRNELKDAPFTLDEVVFFLNKVCSNCELHPDAIIDVMVD